ncbi:unnamed protein product [Citrullus colocynthis]|uniref:Uncharacterized protein n=1 Tax=Citrullus colocynthis TaxID=252529 RepID=A0ABP0XL11_9ROSI
MFVWRPKNSLTGLNAWALGLSFSPKHSSSNHESTIPLYIIKGKKKKKKPKVGASNFRFGQETRRARESKNNTLNRCQPKIVRRRDQPLCFELQGDCVGF